MQEKVLPLVRSIEAEAWLDMFNGASDTLVARLGLRSLRASHAVYLSCKSLPAVPFNRGFSIDPAIGGDIGEISDGLAWMTANAATGWAFQIDPDSPISFREVLTDRGLSQSGSGWVKLTKTVGETETVGHKVKRVTKGTDASLFADLVLNGFGFPPDFSEWFEALVGRARWSCYIAYIDEQPAAVAARYEAKAGDWFGIDTTLPLFRGRGLQRSLIKQRLNDAARHGAQIVMAETGRQPESDAATEPSFRNYLRSGFRANYLSVNYVSYPGAGSSQESTGV
jgi:GNAT superfamily N-acetyltransferase